MLLFFKGIQSQNVLITFLFPKEYFYFAVNVENSLQYSNWGYGDIEYFNTTLEEFKVIYPLKHPIKSQKMTPMMFR